MTRVSQPDEAKATVLAFNRCINSRDLDGLAALMTEDHIFADSDHNAFAGRPAVLEAWSGFFEAFPDYRNHFEELIAEGEGVVVIGRSTCAVEELNGPALWSVRVDNNKVAEWRVYEDTPQTREQLHVA